MNLSDQLLSEDQPLAPGSSVRVVRDGKVVVLQVVRDDSGSVTAIDPNNPDEVQKLDRADLAPDEDEAGRPAAPGAKPTSPSAGPAPAPVAGLTPVRETGAILRDLRSALGEARIKIVFKGHQKTLDGGKLALWNIVLPGHPADGTTFSTPEKFTDAQAYEVARKKVAQLGK